MDLDKIESSEMVDLNFVYMIFYEVINSDSEWDDEDFSDLDDENFSEDDEDDVLEESWDKFNGVSVSIFRNFRVIEVDFEWFGLIYWLYFNLKLMKNLDLFLVYIEIMFYIKGSVEVLYSLFGVLSWDDYILMVIWWIFCFIE